MRILQPGVEFAGMNIDSLRHNALRILLLRPLPAEPSQRWSPRSLSHWDDIGRQPTWIKWCFIVTICAAINIAGCYDQIEFRAVCFCCDLQATLSSVVSDGPQARRGPAADTGRWTYSNSRIREVVAATTAYANHLNLPGELTIFISLTLQNCVLIDGGHVQVVYFILNFSSRLPAPNMASPLLMTLSQSDAVKTRGLVWHLTNSRTS